MKKKKKNEKKKTTHCESYLVFIKNIKGTLLHTVNDPGVDPALSVKWQQILQCSVTAFISCEV